MVWLRWGHDDSAESPLAPQGDRRSVRGRVVCSVAGRVIGC
ncbi:hypothetical protein HMPREF9575_01038 [Cutibacterium acnes HL110PA1]|nr:hypothetical protein HMPREF9575_01038 [Cutibacterium acnes HL110PA1]